MNSILNWKNKLASSWKALPLKTVASYCISSVDKIVNENEYPVQLCNYTDVYNNEFITQDLEFMNSSASSDEIQKFSLSKGDILITKDSESWDDIGIPSLVVDIKPGLLCGYHLALIRPEPKKLYPGFLFRCIQSKDIRTQLELSSTGVTRYGLPKDAIGKLLLPIPEFHIQKRISLFLDKETQNIAFLIKAKEKLIKLLSEKRQTLIFQAVLKGLNPNVKLKDSNIEWLGKIPEHWEIKKIKYLADLKSGEFITSDTIKESDLYPVYGGNGLRGYTSEKTHSGEYVLIGRQGALCGNINFAQGDFWASEHAIVCRPIFVYNVFWFGELLRIMNLNQYSAAAAQPGLSVEVIKNLSIPVPPIEEQDKIIKLINKETTKIDKLKNATLQSIELLKERRSALITAAVTGQIEIPSMQ